VSGMGILEKGVAGWKYMKVRKIDFRSGIDGSKGRCLGKESWLKRSAIEPTKSHSVPIKAGWL
ncbi:hypothetical protein BHE74_00036411, partial [Ensete ventricosum]